jgi:hypothetical protein
MPGDTWTWCYVHKVYGSRLPAVAEESEGMRGR